MVRGAGGRIQRVPVYRHTRHYHGGTGTRAWLVRTATGETRQEWETGAFFRFDRLAALLNAGGTPPFGAADALANLSACLRVYEKRLLLAENRYPAHSIGIKCAG